MAAQRAGNTAPATRSYLRTAEVAAILYVSPKTVSRWAKEVWSLMQLERRLRPEAYRRRRGGHAAGD